MKKSTWTEIGFIAIVTVLVNVAIGAVIWTVDWFMNRNL